MLRYVVYRLRRLSESPHAVALGFAVGRYVPLMASGARIVLEVQAPLVRLRGQWVAVDPEQLRRGLVRYRDREVSATAVMPSAWTP